LLVAACCAELCCRGNPRTRPRGGPLWDGRPRPPARERRLRRPIPIDPAHTLRGRRRAQSSARHAAARRGCHAHGAAASGSGEGGCPPRPSRPLHTDQVARAGPWRTPRGRTARRRGGYARRPGTRGAGAPDLWTAAAVTTWARPPHEGGGPARPPPTPVPLPADAKRGAQGEKTDGGSPSGVQRGAARRNQTLAAAARRATTIGRVTRHLPVRGVGDGGTCPHRDGPRQRRISAAGAASAPPAARGGRGRGCQTPFAVPLVECADSTAPWSPSAASLQHRIRPSTVAGPRASRSAACPARISPLRFHRGRHNIGQGRRHIARGPQSLQVPTGQSQADPGRMVYYGYELGPAVGSPPQAASGSLSNQSTEILQGYRGVAVLRPVACSVF